MLLDEAIHALAFAQGRPASRARLRSCPEDFRVTELPLVEPAGEGEHVWLWLRKRNDTTPRVASQIARAAGVHPKQVSYAGLKDRNAVTEQWFSVQLPGRAAPDWSVMKTDDVEVLRAVRHTRKLRRGTLTGNRFRIVLRDLDGDPADLEQRLTRLAAEGVPNYFGEQRFGRAGSNLDTARQLFASPRRRMQRERRSMALSAARSLLFNRVLSTRVQAGNWATPIVGDALQLAGSHSFFIASMLDDEMLARARRHDVHPTGPLYGRGDTPVSGDCLALEQAVLSAYAPWRDGLEAAGLKQDRRALRLLASDLEWQQTAEGDWQLQFSLPAGAYATSVLRELIVSTALPDNPDPPL